MLRIAILAALFALPNSTSFAYEFLNPVVSGSVRDTAPADGIGDLTVASGVVIRNSSGQNRAIAEFDLNSLPDRKLIYAVFSGQLSAVDTTTTSLRTHKVEGYIGNGTLDLADYSAPGTEVGSIFHVPPNPHQPYVEFTNYLQGRLDAGDDYLGIRVSSVTNPMPHEQLHSTYLEYETYPMGGNTTRFFPKFDVNVSKEAGGPYMLVEDQGGINVAQFPSSGIDRRGVLEYDISSIPAGATITGAKIMFEVNSISSSGNSLVYGYAGDGTASIDDAFQVATQIGTVNFPFGQTGTQTMDVSTQFIQSLVGNSQYLGINMVGSPQGGSLGFYSDEWHTSPYFGLPAQLFIQFTPVPEPATATFAAALFAATALLHRRRASLP